MDHNLVALHALRAELLAQPRYADEKRLSRFGYKVYSQNDEDGILAEIFRRIGVGERTFVEFGVGDGLECNSIWLLMQGWSGLWIEANEKSLKKIRESHQTWLKNRSLHLIDAFITADNINALISGRYKGEIDLLSIDVDYNDYWIWKAISVVNPRVVCIEYNAAWAPPAAVTVPYDANGGWNGKNYFGASLSALAKLGAQKGYDLAGCCLAGVNAFFVRRDLVQDRFFLPGSAEAHYEPARYFLCGIASGHPPAVGQLVIVD